MELKNERCNTCGSFLNEDGSCPICGISVSKAAEPKTPEEGPVRQNDPGHIVIKLSDEEPTQPPKLKEDPADPTEGDRNPAVKEPYGESTGKGEKKPSKGMARIFVAAALLVIAITVFLFVRDQDHDQTSQQETVSFLTPAVETPVELNEKLSDPVEEQESETSQKKSDWVSEISEDVINDEYSLARQKLQPYLSEDPAAKAFYAHLLMSESSDNGAEYRELFAELLREGQDPSKLVGETWSKILGNPINVQIDLDSMGYTAQANGEAESAVVILAHQAEQGSVFAKELLTFEFLYSDGYNNLGTNMINEGLKLPAYDYLLELADMEQEPVALYLTGVAYDLEFLDSGENSEKAQEYYEKSAALFDRLLKGEDLSIGKTGSLSNPLVMYFVGLCYQLGDKPFPVDKGESQTWLLKAAEAGLGPAAFDYAVLLLGGEIAGTVEDCEYWLERAAYCGISSRAFYYYGVLELLLDHSEAAEEAFGIAATIGDEDAKTWQETGQIRIQAFMHDQLVKWGLLSQ